MQLHDLSALEQAAALRRGEVSATGLVEHYLARIGSYADQVGAFVTVTADAARAQAEAADRVLRGTHHHDAGRRPGGQLSALYGVPTAIKDLTLTAGVRTTFGSAAFADFVPVVDADVVALLRAAGTISLGKTTTSELGCSLYSEGLVAPPARNPWDLRCTAGGSSGGAAAAVAAGLLPFAHGSDGGGSIRIPAAICGLVGYKPSRGVVSGGPIGFGAFGLSTAGAITRTVADAAAVLDVLAVPMPGEPYPTPPPPAGGYLAAVLAATADQETVGAAVGAPAASGQLARGQVASGAAQAAAAGVGRLRVGRVTSPALDDAPLDPACLAALDTATKALQTAGHEVVEVPRPFGPDLGPPFETLWYALALSPVPPEREADLLPLTRWLRARGAALGSGALLAALAALQERVRRALRALAHVDLLLSPTLARPQAPVGWFTETGDPAEDFRRQKAFSPYCAVYNVTGQPAVTLPLGQTPDGRPVGVMLADRMGQDARLLAVAAQVEQVAGWRERHPALWRDEPSATVNHG